MKKFTLLFLISIELLAKPVTHLSAPPAERRAPAPGALGNSNPPLIDFIHNLIPNTEHKVPLSEEIAIGLGLRGKVIRPLMYVYEYRGSAIRTALLAMARQPHEREFVTKAIVDIAVNIFIAAFVTLLTDEDRLVKVLLDDKTFEQALTQAVFDTEINSTLKMELVAKAFHLKQDKSEYLERVEEVYATVIPSRQRREAFSTKLRAAQ